VCSISAAEIGFGRQMHEQHTGRAADRARAMTAGADIVGKEYFAAAAPVLPPSLVSTSSVPESTTRSWRREAGCQS